MTNKEAIQVFKEYICDIGMADGKCITDIKIFREAIDMAIKALEQEPTDDATLKDIFCMGCEYKEQESILDKIRAEIESNMESIIGKYDSSIPKFNMPSYKVERNKAREECISIIDKYKAESEE